jgi:hypothetical protein
MGSSWQSSSSRDSNIADCTSLRASAIAVIWYYSVYFKLQRQQRLTIGVVPHGQVQ